MDINRLTKTRDDLCGIQQYYSQSVGPGKYTTTYLVPDARRVNPLAAEQLFFLAFLITFFVGCCCSAQPVL
jgi:hypothetical protein